MPPLAMDHNDTLYGVLSYLGILVVIPLFIRNKSEFAKFHTKQGLVLFLFEIVVSVAGQWILFPFAHPLYEIIELLLFILLIIGLINAVQHKEKELPVIGHLAHSFSF